MREELQQSCKEESPSLSLAFSLLHLWKTQQHTRENAAVFFLNPTASSGHIGFSSRNTRNKRILICFLMCWNPPHRTDSAKHAAYVRHAQGIINVGGIRIEICKDFLGFDAAHHLWSSHNCQAFRTIDRWSQQKRASYCKVQKCSGFLCTSWRRFFHLYTEFSWQEGLWEFVRRRTSLLMFVYQECNLLFCALSFFSLYRSTCLPPCSQEQSPP